MDINDIIDAVYNSLPESIFWVHSSGEIMVQTGLLHRWPPSMANRLRRYLPSHSVSLDAEGEIQLHTGIALDDLLPPPPAPAPPALFN